MEAFNVKFVGAVEKYRVLYDITLTEYSRKDVTDKVWHQVAAEVNLSVSECKGRWKNLRTAFLSSKAKKTYYLHEALKFILPFTKSTNSTTGNLPENPKEPEITDPKDLGVQSLLSASACAEFSSVRPSELPVSAPTPPLIKNSVAPDSMPLVHEQCENTLPKLRQLPQSENSPQKQPSGKKRKIPTSERDVDRAVTEYYTAKKSTLQSKEGRKETAIIQFLNSLVPDLLTLTELRSFKRRTLLLIDEIINTTPLESAYGHSYPHSLQTPSPAGTFLSSYDHSGQTTPQMEIFA